MSRTALIDADILLYELGYSGQIVDKETGELHVYSWDEVKEFFDRKLNIILQESESDDYMFYLTNTKRINKMLNRGRAREEKPQKEFVPNFREEKAVQKDYKANRKQEKPKHFYNVLAHIMGNHPYHVDESGLEADDALCIRQYKSWQEGDTIICSRDKDVRQCPGNHYSWEINKQPSVGPLFIEPLGFLEKKTKTASGKPKPPTLFGGGHKFFYAQLLMGDNTDNIGGLQGYGPVFAYNLLNEATTERQLYELVAEVYVKNCGEDWKTMIKEQASLLWMIRELDEQGNKVEWRPPPREVI
jgi:5'-3' exonuclease